MRARKRCGGSQPKASTTTSPGAAPAASSSQPSTSTPAAPPGAIQASAEASSIRSRTRSPRAARSAASRQQTPTSPWLSITRQKMSHCRAGLRIGAIIGSTIRADDDCRPPDRRRRPCRQQRLPTARRPFPPAMPATMRRAAPPRAAVCSPKWPRCRRCPASTATSTRQGGVLYVGKARNLKKRVVELLPEEPRRHAHRPHDRQDRAAWRPRWCAPRPRRCCSRTT